MGILHQWRNETSQPVEIKLSNQPANQLFYFFYGKIALEPISYAVKNVSKMFVAKMFTAKKL